MFRHHGKERSQKHNLQIAVVLSLIAGMINVTGFLKFHELTTNVTGHFAFFIDDVANLNFWKGTKYFLFILSFLLGSFVAGFLIEFFKDNKRLNVYVLPTILECLILFSIGILSNLLDDIPANMTVCLLLFAMGLQNSFVTKISDAVVRTTHLTGLFTDLGIELAYLFFPRSHPNIQHLKANIQLRIYIICFFFLGGFIGGFLFTELDLGLSTLHIAGAILLLSLFYDEFLFSRRQITNKS